MNAPTIVICVVLAVLFGLAIYHLVRKGSCSGCSEKSSCPAHQGQAGCAGRCFHCAGCSPNSGLHSGEEN